MEQKKRKKFAFARGRGEYTRGRNRGGVTGSKRLNNARRWPITPPPPSSRSRYFISGERESRGSWSDSIELFHPIGPVLLPSGGGGGGGGGISEAGRERRIERRGERNAGEDKADKDEGKEERGIRRKPLSTFYTSGYCIRIYYNLRIPEESDSGRRGTSGEGRGGHRFEGRRKRDR